MTCTSNALVSAYPGVPPNYLSSSSADALISELRPTTLSSPALTHINIFLDELLESLLSASQSINPKDLRLRGVPSAFTGDKSTAQSTGLRALGRSAIGEAEIELRSWYESHSFARKANTGFPPGGKGRGLSSENVNSPFPLQQAVDLLRLKCVAFSTLASQASQPKSVENSVLAAWRNAGGDVSEETVSPAALWTTAILEHVCEHVLAQLASVVTRDSSISVAGVQELYTALCEDESVWGFFRKMKVKDLLELAIRTGAKRGTPNQASAGRDNLLSPKASRVSLVGVSARDPHNDVSSPDKSRSVGISGGVSSTKGLVNGANLRSDSNSGLNTRSGPGGMQNSFDLETSARSSQDEEDEFDALVRSGETMKVSLTPSRLKTFEASPSRGSPQNPARGLRTASDAELPPLLPSPDKTASQLTARADSNRTPSRMGDRSRSNSGKLLARGATTLAELKDEEEDEPLPSHSPLKNAIEDTSSAPTPDLDSGVVDPTKSTVPTDLPSPESAKKVPSQSQTAQLRPAREMTTENTYTGGPLKSKSSSQELAEFLGSTPPPTTYPKAIPSDSNKSSSFKSFMSKVTGRRKEEDRSSTPNPASTSQLRLASGLAEPIAAQRKKSMQSVGTPQLASPIAQVPQNSQPLPNRVELRTKSRELVGGVAVVGGASIIRMTEEQTGMAPSGKSTATTDARTTTDATVDPTTYPSQPQPFESPKPTVPSTYPDRQQNADEAVRPTSLSIPSQSTGLRSPIEPDKSQRDESNRDQYVDLPSASASAASTRLGPDDSLVSVSDANSFRTAEEGESPIEKDRSIAETDTATEIGPFASLPISHGLPSERTLAKMPPMPTPSIALADLVPLRTILQHATSAAECQLLLSAVLTQWGVPQTVDGGSTAQPTPESRVTAWLLAGREGPIDPETHSSSTFSKVGDDIMTPKQEESTRLPSVPTGEPFNTDKDVEVLSTNTANAVSLSGEDLHEGLNPSVAKTAQQISPSVPAGPGGQLPGSVDVSTKGGVMSAGI